MLEFLSDSDLADLDDFDMEFAELPFVDLVLTQNGVDIYNDKERARCERLVRWWKMKVKHHRTLDADEAKALRMISKAFAKGEDHEDDPEHLLYR